MPTEFHPARQFATVVLIVIFAIGTAIHLADITRFGFLGCSRVCGVPQAGFAAANMLNSGIQFSMDMGVALALCNLTMTALLKDKDRMVRRLGVWNI